MTTLRNVNYSGPKAKRQALADFKAGTLQVTRVGYLAADKTLLAPVIQVDATARPDLHDLARVHRSEGSFDTVTAWDFCISTGMTGLARLSVDINRPVKTRFTILFPLQKFFDYLDNLADDFTFLSVKFDSSPMGDALAFTYDPASLKQGLTLYAATRLFTSEKGGRGL
jgi:hypothetical protein